MSASAVKQRSIIRQYKYPTQEEAHAKIIYYRESRDIIKAFHAARHPIEFLRDQSERLLRLALGNTGTTKTRLRNNSRALMQYADFFGEKEYEILGDVGYRLNFADVTITVYPDLHVLENGIEKIIKLDFDAKEPDKDFVMIMSQCLYEGAKSAGQDLKSSCVLYADVPRGRLHKGARAGSRTLRNIEATCQTIADIWDRI